MGAFLRQEWWIVAVFMASLVPLVHLLVTGGVPALRALDRRWIFLLMFWSVLLPIYYVSATGNVAMKLRNAVGTVRKIVISWRRNHSGSGANPCFLLSNG